MDDRVRSRGYVVETVSEASVPVGSVPIMFFRISSPVDPRR